MAKNRYHYNGSKTATSKDQPIHLTKWVTVWVLPDALRKKYGNVAIIDDQLQKISGLDSDKMPAMVEQKVFGVSRKFVGSVTDTNITINMDFEVNKDGKTGEIYPFCLFRDWNKLQYDFETGLATEKVDYCGSIVIENHDLKGNVLRKVNAGVIFMEKAIPNWDLDRNTEKIYKMSLGFVIENVSLSYQK
jgi:hypothetical protein